MFNQIEEYEKDKLLLKKNTDVGHSYFTPKIGDRYTNVNPVYTARALGNQYHKTDSVNKPRQFRSIMSKKAPIGHNIALDLVSSNKVVNNDIGKFFKQKGYTPLTIDTARF